MENSKHGCTRGCGLMWGDEKEVMKVLKLDPLNSPVHFYDFKNNKLTIL
jgi:hypothetical protein